MDKDKEGRVDSIIGRSTLIKGDMKVDGSLKMDGRIEGNVSASEIFIAGKDSTTKGNVQCKGAIIAGRIDGNVSAHTTVEMQQGAHIVGDIICKGLIVQDGVFFEGNCRMSEKEKSEKKPPESK